MKSSVAHNKGITRFSGLLTHPSLAYLGDCMLRERSVIPAAALLEVISFCALYIFACCCKFYDLLYDGASIQQFVRHADIFVAPQMCFSESPKCIAHSRHNRMYLYLGCCGAVSASRALRGYSESNP